MWKYGQIQYMCILNQFVNQFATDKEVYFHGVETAAFSCSEYCNLFFGSGLGG